MNIAKISTLKLSFSNTFDILNAPKYAYLSFGAKATYAYLYDWCKKNSHAIVIDKVTGYECIRLTRKTIANDLLISYKTAIKYIKELAYAKLIRDTRVGLTMVNKISFYDVDEEYKYRAEESKQSNKQDESPEVLDVPSIPEEVVGAISEVKTKIFDAFGESIDTKAAKQILMITKSDPSLLDKALEYMAGKAYDNFMAKLADTIRKRYWEKVKPSTPAVPKSTKPPNSKRQPNKNERFTNISSHNMDMDFISRVEDARILLSLGQITQEKYDSLFEKSENKGAE